MIDEIKKHILSLKKADLHVHLEGSVDYQTLQELSEINSISLDEDVYIGELTFDAKLAFESLHNQGIMRISFEEFIAIYLKTTSLLQTSDDIELIAQRFAKSCQEQNVTYCEIYVSPTTFIALGTNIEGIFSGLKSAQENVLRDYGIKFRWIFDIVRGSSEDGSEALELAVMARNGGVDVMALGLAGYEVYAPSKQFAKTFSKARDLGFVTLAHSGECTPASCVDETIEFLSPARIGHGLSVMEDPELMARLRETQTPIEVCPWSNIILKNAKEFEHPALEMHRAGLMITIGSDDPGIFQKSLVDNYLFLYQLGASKEELSIIAENSLKLIK